jgi:RNA polymerase sigma-70 factor (family 1)
LLFRLTIRMTYDSDISDYDLILMLKTGHKAAYTAIYDRYKRLLFDHAFKKTGDADAAQDILQDVFLNLWTHRNQISESDNIKGYLYTAVRNKVFNSIAHSRVRSIYTASITQYAQTADITTDHLIREKQFSELIDLEIASLPEKMRNIFLLSRKEHMKNKQIAEQLNLSEHTVATQIKRAIKILKKRLGPFVFLYPFLL